MTKRKHNITYVDREVLAPRVGQRVNFEITNYQVKGYTNVNQEFGIFRIMALGMTEINNPTCQIGHMLLKLRVPHHVYHYANALLKAKQPVQLSATIRRYKHKSHRHSHKIFKQLEAVKNGEIIGEMEPLRSFGLSDTRIKLPFDLNFELNESKHEVWTDYKGDLATAVKRHLAFETTLDWLKENLCHLSEDDQSQLLNWVENIRCCDLISQNNERVDIE